MKIDSKLLIVGLVGIVIIGGIALYMKPITPKKSKPATIDQLIEKCAFYNAKPGQIPARFDEVQAFINVLESKLPVDIPKESTTAFNVCLQDLRMNIKKYGVLQRK